MDALSLVKWRLMKRAAALNGLLLLCTIAVLAARLHSNTFSLLALFCMLGHSVLTAAISPGASEDDLRSSPVLERILFFSSISGAAAALLYWSQRPPTPCGAIASGPGLAMVLAWCCVPVLGMKSQMHYWPAGRTAVSIMGVLQVARVTAQTHAVRLAGTLSALGASDLLPMSVAERCQAHGLFLPGQVSWASAISFGWLALSLGLLLTPAIRTTLASLLGSFGLRAACVVHLNEGILLEPSDERGRADGALDDGASTVESSGIFGGKKASLWSGWSASWSDAGETYQAKLTRRLGGCNTLPRDFATMQKVIQEAKASLMQEEARKATRRAADHGKAHGRLVWQLVRRAQKRPECLLSILPRDALRLIVERFIADETVRLEELYLTRVRAGATSYRG